MRLIKRKYGKIYMIVTHNDELFVNNELHKDILLIHKGTYGNKFSEFEIKVLTKPKNIEEISW